MKHPALRQVPAALIGGRWVPLPKAQPSAEHTSRNPARPDQVLWSAGVDHAHVNQAVAAARAALPAWSSAPFEHRAAVLRRFAEIAAKRVDDVTAVIRDEVGKVTWDAKAEAQLLAAKVDITLDPAGPLQRVSGFDTGLTGTKLGRCWFRPHGVMAVLAPFNFPCHLPNGHIVPALAMGNTVVLKPSEKTPACGQILAELFHEALESCGAPAGVVNLIQGHTKEAAALSSHDDIDGVLFTGSWPVGRRIMEANLDRPGRILALEMGGNNPAIIMDDADLRQAVIECVRCAFITSGQRCTCTRRLIVHRAVADAVIPALCKAAAELIMGDPAAAHPVFMGPVINANSRSFILEAQRALQKAGGEVLVQATETDGGTGGAYLTPGVMRVDRFTVEAAETPASCTEAGADLEVFGPFLRLSIADSLDDAIEQANATRFGLAASIFTRSEASARRFQSEARAGCINWNTGTAGASSKLPFGGLGYSGNHRPAGAFSLDYCAYPVAGMIEQSDAALISPGMRFDDAWLK